MSIPEYEQQPYTAPGASTAYDPVTGAPTGTGAVPPPPPSGYHVNGIFGLFVAGWIFYMAFEAYQTARARREGLPLPDPFGLNSIGERFGFHPQEHPDLGNFYDQTLGKMPGAAPIHKEWNVDADGGAYYSRTDATGAKTTYQVDPEGNVSSSKTAGAGYPPPPPPPGYGYGQAPYGVPPVQPPPAWAPPPPPVYGMPPMPPMPPRSGLPTGAIWLIGLGAFALLGSLHPFAFLEGEATGGLFLMALGAFMFYKRQSTLSGMYPAGSPGTKYLWARSMRGAGVVFIVGLLTFFQGIHLVRWESSWPLLLIFLGVMILVERSTANQMVAPPYPTGYPPVPPTAPVEPVMDTSSDTSIVPKYTRPSNDLGNEEGR
jgi:hypothetical protein